MTEEIDSTYSDIRSIVDRVRSGEIPKTEALAGLKSTLQTNALRRASMNPNTSDLNISQDLNTSQGNTSQNADDNHSVSSNGGTRMTREDRLNVINQLMEKKRSNSSESDRYNKYGMSPPLMDDTVSSVVGSDRLPSSVGMMMDAGDAWSQSEDRDIQEYRDEYGVPSYGDNTARPHQRTLREERSFRKFDESMTDFRASQILKQEASIRQDMFKECTFHPQIKPLPASYGAMKDKDTPFYARVTKWQKDKDLDKRNRKDNFAADEVKDCSFHPRIDSHSSRAVKLLRGDDGELANERLYKSAETTQMQRKKFVEEEIHQEILRETKECTFRPQLVTKKKFVDVGPKYDREVAPGTYLKPRVQDPELKECTFTPKVKGVKSRMNSAKIYVSTNVVDRLCRSSTSSSLVNTPYAGPNGGHRGRNGEWDPSQNLNFSDRPVMDVASFMGSLGTTAATAGASAGGVGYGEDVSSSVASSMSSFHRPNSARSMSTGRGGSAGQFNSQFQGATATTPYQTPRAVRSSISNNFQGYNNNNNNNNNISTHSYSSYGDRGSNSVPRKRPASAPRERTASNLSEDSAQRRLNNGEPSERDMRFAMFLGRQQQSVMRRDKNIQDVYRATTPKFKPDLVTNRSSSGSHMIVSGSFIDRVERDFTRRASEFNKREIPSDHELTFQPHILKKSASLPSRSVDDLCYNDAMRKETSLTTVKARVLQDRMQDVTFQPKLVSKVSMRAKSKLAFHEDPEKFLKWYQEHQEKKKEIKVERDRERDENDIKDCTFRPDIIDCPNYIKRIAKSMAVVRQAKSQSSIQSMDLSKPDWR